MKKPDITRIVELKPVTIDDLASVRYIHKSSFEAFCGTNHSDEEVQAHIDMVNSQYYADHILSNNMYCAWIGDEMVGTAGWSPADDSGHTARINLLSVSPMFNGLGIGRLLVRSTEKRASEAGFNDYSVRSNINAVPFYQHHGYRISSHGIMHTRTKIDLPVAFMRKFCVPVNQNIPTADRQATFLRA